MVNKVLSYRGIFLIGSAFHKWFNINRFINELRENDLVKCSPNQANY